MTTVKVHAFDGLVPRLSPSLLGEQFAQTADNVKLYSKELRFWRGPSLTHGLPGASTRSVYRLYNGPSSSVWLAWTGDVDAVPAPVADISEFRVYFTGDGKPKKTNYSMATAGAEPYPVQAFDIGVPSPSAPAHVTVTVDGSGTAEDRSYVFTFVTTFGNLKEESKPSTAATVVVHPNGASVTIDTFPATPTGNFNITHRRIYRTVVGATTTNFLFVAEIPLATTSYTDSLTTLQLGENLQTIGWDMPPDALTGLVALPGGSLAGFVSNTVFFSEPFFPHAWPLRYAITLPANIVGLAIMGSDVVVMTDTTPFFIHGGLPGEMYVERIQLQEPCVGKHTIATDGDGVIYASPNGLVGISPDTRALLTQALFTSDEWQPLIPATMRGVVYQGRYVGVFPDEVPPRAIVLNKRDSPALSHLSLGAAVTYVDAKNGFLFYVDDVTGDIMQLDADTAQPLNFEWKSKRWHLDAATTFSVIRLDADYEQVADATAYNAALAVIEASNAALFASDLQGALNAAALDVFAINGSTMANLPEAASSRTVQVVIYGDGEAVANVTFDSLDPVRLQPFKCRELEFSILGNVNVRSVHMATTMDELKAL